MLKFPASLSEKKTVTCLSPSTSKSCHVGFLFIRYIRLIYLAVSATYLNGNRISDGKHPMKKTLYKGRIEINIRNAPKG